MTVLRPNKESFDRIDRKLRLFIGLRHDLHTDCQIKIAYSWRKYIKRKKARLAKEAAAKAKKLAAKKGKKGKTNKKRSVTVKKMPTAEPANTTTKAESIVKAADLGKQLLKAGTEMPSVDIKVDGVDVVDKESQDDNEHSPHNHSDKDKGTAIKEQTEDEDDEHDGIQRKSTLIDLREDETTPMDLLDRKSNDDELEQPEVGADDDRPTDDTPVQ